MTEGLSKTSQPASNNSPSRRLNLKASGSRSLKQTLAPTGPPSPSFPAGQRANPAHISFTQTSHSENPRGDHTLHVRLAEQKQLVKGTDCTPNYLARRCGPEVCETECRLGGNAGTPQYFLLSPDDYFVTESLTSRWYSSFSLPSRTSMVA